MKESNTLIVKSNALIEAFTDMTTLQYKFTLYVISKLNRNSETFNRVDVPVKKYSELLGVAPSNIYENMKEFERELGKKIVSLALSNGNRLTIPWFEYLYYKHNEGILSVSFNQKLCPFLLNLNKAFTMYLIANVKNMKSIYSIRFYEIMKKEQFKGKIILRIDNLRDIFQLKRNEYKLFGDFNRRVLKRSEQEINEKTDIFISGRKDIKENRKVVAIEYIIDKTPDYMGTDIKRFELEDKRSGTGKGTAFEQRTYSDEFYEALYETGT